jgi:hypothetical protein
MIRPRVALYVLIISCVCVIASLVVVSIALISVHNETAHTEQVVHANQRQSDQRWCSLFESIERPPDQPPTTPPAKRFDTALRELAKEFGCTQ